MNAAFVLNELNLVGAFNVTNLPGQTFASFPRPIVMVLKSNGFLSRAVTLEMCTRGSISHRLLETPDSLKWSFSARISCCARNACRKRRPWKTDRGSLGKV